MEERTIHSAQQICELWKGVYSAQGGVDWSGLLPYYSNDIVFKDSIQEIHGIKNFTAMTDRLARRSRNLEFIVHSSVMESELIFVEWEMVISYKSYPTSSVFGASRMTLRDGKIVYQRDYYDLWGDIFDNIWFLKKAYRLFMKRSFG